MNKFRPQPIASLRSMPRQLNADFAPRDAPPGWTLDDDIREEHLALSEIAMNRRTG